ncbi:hypothetical protein U1Q18_024511 [Sarracenia purpurea var. burkii]
MGLWIKTLSRRKPEFSANHPTFLSFLAQGSAKDRRSAALDGEGRQCWKSNVGWTNVLKFGDVGPVVLDRSSDEEVGVSDQTHARRPKYEGLYARSLGRTICSGPVNLLTKSLNSAALTCGGRRRNLGRSVMADTELTHLT